MKKFIICLFMVLQVAALKSLYAQNKVKRFCELYISNSTMPFTAAYRINIKVDYGQSKVFTPFRDSTVGTLLKRAEGFNTLSSAMNYMTSLGWKYEMNMAASDAGNSWARIIFSKEFDKSDLTE